MAPLTGNHPVAKPSAAAGGMVDVLLSAAACWYLTGLLTALAFSFGFYLVRPAPGIGGARREFADAFTWMDGKWYKQIATEGYRYDPNVRSNIAFFPVYPLLGRAVMAVTGLGAEWALVFVSNVSFLGALALLALYVRGRPVGQAFQPDGRVNDGAARGEWTVLAAALFPTGCFFRLAYSESTCLLLLVLAMFAMRRRWPLWSIALVVGLATAARPVGVALLAPFAIHIFRQSYARPVAEALARGPCGLGRRRFAFACAHLLLYLPVACWGLLAFMAYQWHAFGDPLAVFKAHGHWSIRPEVPWFEKSLALATFEPIRSVYQNQSPAFWGSIDLHGMPWFSMQFANPLFFLAAIMLVTFGAWRRWLSLEEVSLGALLLFIPYVTRAYEMGMGSMGRFTAIVFPVHLVIGHIWAPLPGAVRSALSAVAGFFLAAYAALYAGGHVVF